MKIIICGATGFIGKNLVNYFSQFNNEVIAVYFNSEPMNINSRNVQWIRADLRKPHSLSNYLKETDLLLQFAATTSGSMDIVKTPYIHVTDNAVLNSYLLRECFEAKVKHFVFPSCTVMLQSKENQSESDWDPSNPIHPNYFGVGNTKLYIEQMCRFYSNHGLKTTVIRHSNVYGPHDKFDLIKSHVLGATVRKVLNAEPGSVINVWGSGKARRDFIYVDDLVRFIELVFLNQNSIFSLYNCGSGHSVSVNQLVEKAISLSGKDLSLHNDLTKPDIPTALSLNCQKAFKEINWKSEINLDVGLKKTFEWLNQNLKTLQH